MAAAVYGEILDIPFPQIPPEKDERYIHDLAEKYASIIENDLVHSDNNAVHVMGEMTFTYDLIKTLSLKGITCIASTTERIVRDISDNKREITFDFVRFRKYE